MLTPDEIREFLQDHNLTAVAEKTGLSTDTLYRFMAGGTPSVPTLQALDTYIKSKVNRG
jgi:DNA-binding phage protein